MPDDDGFLARWSRRKASARDGQPLAEPVAPAHEPLAPAHGLAAPAAPGPDGAPPPAPAPAPAAATEPDAPPLPTLAEARALTRDADFRRFVAPGVPAEVRNTALKTLFSDPHFNVMDGLDIYIDDYGRPDPLPAGRQRQLAQSSALGLFRDQPAAPAGAADAAGTPCAATAPAAAARHATIEPATTEPATTEPASAAPDTDEDADLRLQPHDAAGRARAAARPVPDAGG